MAKKEKDYLKGPIRVLECPNCGKSHLLKVTKTGEATCPHGKVKLNLNVNDLIEKPPPASTFANKFEHRDAMKRWHFGQ